MPEHLNKGKNIFASMAKNDAVDKIIRLVVYLVIIYLFLKFFKVL
jgi:hypothetical protein